jgi:hypothetical protein
MFTCQLDAVRDGFIASAAARGAAHRTGGKQRAHSQIEANRHEACDGYRSLEPASRRLFPLLYRNVNEGIRPEIRMELRLSTTSIGRRTRSFSAGSMSCFKSSSIPES